jgi:NaMN:DMB phosphoribosyltransferase
MDRTNDTTSIAINGGAVMASAVTGMAWWWDMPLLFAGFATYVAVALLWSLWRDIRTCSCGG